MKVAILGAGGQLGRALVAALPASDAFSHDDLDISDAAAVRGMDWSRYDTVFNAAAYTAVDAAETPEGRVTAWRVNATGVRNLARAACDHELALVQVSTDYVFDGHHRAAIPEDAPVSPLNTYGASKAAGEITASLAPKHYVVRTSWVVGEGSNFVRTMVDLAARGIAPTVVADQVGRLTYAEDLAKGLVELVTAGPSYGTYHLSNSGEPGSWAQIARTIFAAVGRSPEDINDTTTAAYVADRITAARRPLNSVLDIAKAGAVGVELPSWQDALSRYLLKEVAVP